MKRKQEMQARAIRLRKKGLSYSEICKQVPVSKSSLSLWLKNVRLSPEHRARLYTKQIEILARGTPSQVERRKKEIASIIEQARKEVECPLQFETFRLLGAALYWAEGSKTQNFEITNSDPLLIAFMAQWFEKVFAIPPVTLKAHLNMYPQQNERDLKKFWSQLTGIPVKNFGKSFVKPAGTGYKKNNLYYGTIKIRVPRGTDMRHRVYAWIQAALQDLAPTLESTKLRWSRLRSVERPPVNLATAHSSISRAGRS